MFYKIKLLEFDFYPLFSKFKEYSEKTRNITKLLIYHYHNNNTYNNIHHPMPFEKKMEIDDYYFQNLADYIYYKTNIIPINFVDYYYNKIIFKSILFFFENFLLKILFFFDKTFF